VRAAEMVLTRERGGLWQCRIRVLETLGFPIWDLSPKIKIGITDFELGILDS